MSEARNVTVEQRTCYCKPDETCNKCDPPEPVGADWPRDPANGRLLCSPERPMPKGAPGQWAHTNIQTVGDDSDFSTGQEWDRRRCKDCGVEWYEEIAQ